MREDVRRGRQLEGIAMARRQGVCTGWKPRLDKERVKELSSRGLGRAAIAREQGFCSPVWAAPNQPNTRRIDGIESLLARVLDDAADAPPLTGLHHVDTPFGVSPNAVN